MPLCNAILGKDIYDLELADLESFFSTEQEETSVLEFKSGNTSLEAIHKEVSAFLNTEGGLLIIGSPIEQKSGTSKVCKGPLDPCMKILDQDTLLRSIAANIAPSPMNIKAKSFPVGGGMVFILEIGQSVTPPHQVSNEGKYYIRLERDAKAAPHGIIEALFNRRQRPKLIGQVQFLDLEARDDVRIIFDVSNESIISAEYIGVSISIYGVEEVREITGIRSDKYLKDGALLIQDTFDKTILVPGISLNFSATVKLLNRFAFVEFSFYCKDGTLQTKQRFFYTKPFEMIKRYDSIENSEADSVSIKDEYRGIQRNRIREILSVNQNNQLSEPASPESIFNLFDLLGTELPNTYFRFLETSDGFDGYISERHLKLFSLKEIKENIADFKFRIHSNLVVGMLDDYPIHIRWVEEDDRIDVIFVWDQWEYSQLSMDNKASSFFGFLNKINSVAKHYRQPRKLDGI